MKTKKEITTNDLAKLIGILGTKVEKISTKVEKLSVKMDNGFKDQEKRFDAKFKEQDIKFDEKFKLQDKRFDEKFKEQDIKFDAKFELHDKRTDKKIDNKIAELALIIAKGFEQTASKKDLENYATKEELNSFKEDVYSKIDKSQEYLSNIIHSAKGDLILIIRKLDEKIIVLIDILKGQRILSEDEYEKLCKMKTFPTIELKS